MRKGLMKRITSVAMAALMLTGVSVMSAGSVSAVGTTKTSQTNIEIPFNGSGTTLESNKTYKLPALISGLTGTKYEVSVSNNRIAKVKNGEITTNGTGSLTVTVTLANGIKLSKTFTVVKPEVQINVSTDVVLLKPGQKKALQAIVSQSKGKLTWSSSNSKVVSVDRNGRLTAKKDGIATVTVKTTTGKTASVKIRVGEGIPVEAVRLNATKQTIEVGQSFQIHAVTVPANATDNSLKCTTTDAKVASVSYGKVTGRSAGTAYITVKSANGKSSVCTVTVVDPVPVTKVNINKTNVTLHVGEKFQLHASAAPENATNKALKCTTSNSSVASVSYGKITAESVGTAKITVTSSNGKTAVCTVKVIK